MLHLAVPTRSVGWVWRLVDVVDADQARLPPGDGTVALRPALVTTLRSQGAKLR